MLLKLNIQEDEELRGVVKELVKGQVRSVTREEIKQMILDDFAKKIDTQVYGMVEEVLDRNFKFLYSHGLQTYINVLVEKIIENRVGQAIKDQVDFYIKNLVRINMRNVVISLEEKPKEEKPVSSGE